MIDSLTQMIRNLANSLNQPLTLKEFGDKTDLEKHLDKWQQERLRINEPHQKIIMVI